MSGSAVACHQCGTQAPPGRDPAEADERAREQHFEQRGEGWVCPECVAGERSPP